MLDLTGAEGTGQYFEGTGVLVVDRINGVAYVSLSERADRALAEVGGAGVGGWEQRCVSRSSGA